MSKPVYDGPAIELVGLTKCLGKAGDGKGDNPVDVLSKGAKR